MTTILTPAEQVPIGAEFEVGQTRYTVGWDGVARTCCDRIPAYFNRPQLAIIFPDGVPVIQPDKPKEVRCVAVGLPLNRYLLDGAPNWNAHYWVRANTQPGKTYDLVLTEREDSK